MPTNRRKIVFSEPFARIKDNQFYICAEDIDGLQWELAGPLADVDFAQALRQAFVVFEDGWAYLEDVREALDLNRRVKA